jgi:hypothetical protein
MIVRRAAQALALAAGGALAFAAGAVIGEQVMFHDAREGVDLVAERTAGAILRWKNLSPLAHWDANGVKQCKGIDIETGETVGPWTAEPDGTCRIRTYILARVIDRLSAATHKEADK